MPDWLLDLLKLWGFDASVLHAGAVLGVFYFLDSQLSPSAKEALTAWFDQGPVERAFLSKAMVEAFDQVHYRPLLSWRALWRCSVLILLLTGIAAAMRFGIESFYPRGKGIFMPYILYADILFNIVAAYASLFLIRKLLNFSAQKPLIILFAGAVIGAIITASSWMLRTLAISMLALAESKDILDQKYTVWSYASQTMFNQLSPFDYSNFYYWVLPIFAVYLWLAVIPVTALIGTIASKLDTVFLGGRERRLRNIGYIASGLTLLLGAVGHILST
jgi:hypothetical protein